VETIDVGVGCRGRPWDHLPSTRPGARDQGDAGPLECQKGEKDAVFLSWGHLLPTEGPTRGEDVEGYQLLTPRGSVQILATDKESDQRNVVHLEEEGLYTAAAIRKPSVLTVFTLGDQHVHFLGPKTEVREGGNIEDSFRSFQFAKALVTAGNASETPKPIGHTLEIVPTTPPRPGPSAGTFRSRSFSRASRSSASSFRPSRWISSPTTSGPGPAPPTSAARRFSVLTAPAPGF
jgi:hypothetical protein